MAGAREVHLVGSVPLSSADAVFRTASAALGELLPRFPDGETGLRKNWMNFQFGVLARHPAFEFAGPPVGDPDELALESDGRGADYRVTPLRLRPGASAANLKFGELGYAVNALDSYRLFAELKRAGTIHRGARFQVSLPTPLAPVAIFVVPANLFDVFPAYAQALARELNRILAGIPHGELAIQWDVAVEFGLWEGLFPPPPGDWKGMLLGQMAELGSRVPAAVTLGYHLCYGDCDHKHFAEPKDTGNLVEMANGIAGSLKRPSSGCTCRYRGSATTTPTTRRSPASRCRRRRGSSPGSSTAPTGWRARAAASPPPSGWSPASASPPVWARPPPAGRICPTSSPSTPRSRPSSKFRPGASSRAPRRQGGDDGRALAHPEAVGLELGQRSMSMPAALVQFSVTRR